MQVDTIAPDPEVAGSEGKVVLELKGWEQPEEPKDDGLAERMRERGMWLPGDG